jgi:MSHA pilin protein MshD
LCTCSDRGRPGHASPRSGQAGVTLVELVVAIAILSVAVAGTLSVIRRTTLGSADPMLMQQASFVAEAYLAEILTKSFPTVAPCPAPAVPRASYTSVCDYALIADEDPTDQNGTAIPGLETLGVTVTVDLAAQLDTLVGMAGGVVRIDVQVTYTGGEVQLSAYRTDLGG